MRKCASISLSLSYQRKGWQAGPHQSLVWHRLQNIVAADPQSWLLVKATEYTFIVGVISKEGLVGPACQTFLGYDNDKDLKVQFPMTQLTFLWRWNTTTSIYISHVVIADALKLFDEPVDLGGALQDDEEDLFHVPGSRQERTDSALRKKLEAEQEDTSQLLKWGQFL